MKIYTRFLLSFLLFSSVAGAEDLKKLEVNGVEIHYVDAGKGIPVVFVHGGLVDYRRWSPQIEPFSKQYRVISYSRRYNFPNQNAQSGNEHSAIVEAEDLAALIKALKLPPAHVIGESYGAYTALMLAIRHPNLVRTLVLAEPPVLDWLADLPGGKAHVDRFFNELWNPLRPLLNQNDENQAIRIIWDYFVGKDAEVPEPIRSQIQQNLKEWKVLISSKDAFPEVTTRMVRQMKAPVLMMTGENTMELFKLLDPYTESKIPNVKRVVVPKASHEMWDEYPEVCRNIVLPFLAEH